MPSLASGFRSYLWSQEKAKSALGRTMQQPYIRASDIAIFRLPAKALSFLLFKLVMLYTVYKRGCAYVNTYLHKVVNYFKKRYNLRQYWGFQ